MKLIVLLFLLTVFLAACLISGIYAVKLNSILLGFLCLVFIAAIVGTTNSIFTYLRVLIIEEDNKQKKEGDSLVRENEKK
jgi:hypothetical protein